MLPDTSYLERLELPDHSLAKVPAVALCDRVLEKVHQHASGIFSELAEARGRAFSVDELADAQLKPWYVAGNAEEDGRRTSSKVLLRLHASGRRHEKVQFASEACERLNCRLSVWVQTAVVTHGRRAALIGGKQAIHSHTQTANIEGCHADQC